MRKAFMCSLCHNGILGGGLYLDNQSITYRTQKLTVDEKYKNLVLPLDEIIKIRWKWVIFPVATFQMKIVRDAIFESIVPGVKNMADGEAARRKNRENHPLGTDLWGECGMRILVRQY